MNEMSCFSTSLRRLLGRQKYFFPSTVNTSSSRHIDEDTENVHLVDHLSSFVIAPG